jgi:predicted acetyltransferase
MSIEIRPAIAPEMGQLGLMGAYSYGGAFGDGPDNVVATGTRPEWTLCAFDTAVRQADGQPTMATSFSAFPFTTRVNGNAVPLAGISTVGTRPEYRRQGMVRKIMTQAFADQYQRGQCLAGLWASQAAIYQRYGFAASGGLREYRIDTTDIHLHQDVAAMPVVRFEGIEALDAVREVYKQFIAARTGYLHRGKSLWLDNVLAPPSEDGPAYVALVGSLEAPTGYLVYTLRAGRVAHRARAQEICIRDFGWLDLASYASLWHYLGRHDLVGRVVWGRAPVDDPAPDLFVEPRLLHTQDLEGTWWRVVDAQSALMLRGYDVEGSLVLAIADDELAPWNNGRWHLDVGPQGAEVRATAAAADIELSVRALSSLYSGNRSAQQLANAGLLAGDPDTLVKLDQMMRTRYAPHCPDHY